LAEYINQQYSINARFEELLVSALEESLQPLEEKEKIMLLLALPKDRPGLDFTLPIELKKVVSEVVAQSGKRIEIEMIREDHDSGLIAINRADELIQNEKTDFCLVAGVDSFVHQDTVSWLEDSGKLKCSSNRNGFVPGEAAAGCLICNEKTAIRLNLPVLANILGVASAEEPSFSQKDVPNGGRGLSRAIGQVLEPLSEGERVRETFCTMKGVRHEALEYSFAAMRCGSLLEQPTEYTALTPFWGDIGAASGPALIVYAIEKKSLGFSEAGHNLIFTQSPGGSRSAALVQTL
jgi:3-oxoacyl-[acyl-carrier-protein] synthase I